MRGVVEDSATHAPLPNASVTYLRKGKTLTFTRTTQQGTFALTVPTTEMGDQVQASMLGYGKKRRGVPLKAGGNTTVTLALPSQAFALKEVKVQGSRVTGRDTITYDLTRFSSERDNSLKDVLRKLPGVEVDKTGNISYNGKGISRFTVEGLDLTGGRYNQLTENIRAKDVKKAEIVEHDQPIKALQNRVYTDNVGMNVTLKDEARDKFMATVRPYLLFDDPTHMAGSANVRQIGKRKQQMFDLAYDRKGQDISNAYLVLAAYGDRLSAATLPTWYTVPSLSAPIDADRLRFNTSQRYAANRVQKTKSGDELRLAAQYVRAVIRQETANTATYYLDGETPTLTDEQKQLTLTTDNFSAELEHKLNTEHAYGNEVLSIKASQGDGLSVVTNSGSGETSARSLSQRVRVPQLDLSGSLYRMFPLRNGAQLTWKAVADYHHSVNDLYIDEAHHSDLPLGSSKNRLRTNLWHTENQLGWMRKRGEWTQRYTGGVAVENTHAEADNLRLRLYLNPYWQYKHDDLTLSFSPRLSYDRYTRQQTTLLFLAPTAYLNWQPTARTEWTLSGSYSEAAGSARNYAIDSYQRDYRTWYVASGIIPRNRSLTARLAYRYKRPIREFFLNATLSPSRMWTNTATDMQITDGNYYYSLKEQHSHSDNLRGELSASKGFYALNLKTSLALSGTLSKGQQLSADRWIAYTTRSLTLTPGINWAPKWCEVDYEGTFSLSGNKASGQTLTTLFNWRQRIALTATIGKLDLKWALIHYRNELPSTNADGNRRDATALNTLLSDASATWRLKKLRLSAELRNLFNKQRYEVTTYSGIASTTASYLLRPRECLLTAQFSL